MGIFIFTKKETLLKKAFPKDAEFITEKKSKQKFSEGDISYLDISGISAANISTSVAELKKICKDGSWGIIDPKGSVKDSAALFFEGASDYLGPDFFKTSKAIDPMRLKTASQWRLALTGSKKTGKGECADASADSKGKKIPARLPKTGVMLPSASVFPGWRNIKTGKTMPFYLLYCSIKGSMDLGTRFGEKALAQLHQRFLAYLFQNFQEGDGLIWMDSGKDFLFLLPPRAKCAEAAVLACIRMLLSAPLIALEILNLTIPVNFVFALHYGSVSYKPPGSTGTVVSDAVNHVFHLGAKKAETGRLTITGEIPDGSVPEALEDCFIPAGEYEGRKIYHTKKFSYVKPWL